MISNDYTVTATGTMDGVQFYDLSLAVPCSAGITDAVCLTIDEPAILLDAPAKLQPRWANFAPQYYFPPGLWRFLISLGDLWKHLCVRHTNPSLHRSEVLPAPGGL